MSRGTQIKDAIAQWEQREGCKVDEAEDVKLYAMFIEKMDTSMSLLSHVSKLSLSTNCIEKIANLNGFKNLRILSLGRNNIKNFIGLEVVADTLEQLWISYNKIERLTGIRYMKALKVLYISNNNIADWDEMRKLCELQHLEDILFANNPVEERYSAEGNWREKVAALLPKLRKLDGVPVIRLDDERFGLERLNLDDNTLAERPTKTPGTKTRPSTQMGAKTPDPKSARGMRSARDDRPESQPKNDKDENKTAGNKNNEKDEHKHVIYENKAPIEDEGEKTNEGSELKEENTAEGKGKCKDDNNKNVGDKAKETKEKPAAGKKPTKPEAAQKDKTAANAKNSKAAANTKNEKATSDTKKAKGATDAKKDKAADSKKDKPSDAKKEKAAAGGKKETKGDAKKDKPADSKKDKATAESKKDKAADSKEEKATTDPKKETADENTEKRE